MRRPDFDRHHNRSRRLRDDRLDYRGSYSDNGLPWFRDDEVQLRDLLRALRCRRRASGKIDIYISRGAH